MIYYDKPLITALRMGIDTLLCQACKLSRSQMRAAFLVQIAEAEETLHNADTPRDVCFIVDTSI